MYNVNEELWLLCHEHDTVRRRYLCRGRLLLRVSPLSSGPVVGTLRRKYIIRRAYYNTSPVYKLPLFKKKNVYRCIKNNVLGSSRAKRLLKNIMYNILCARIHTVPPLPRS